MLERIPANAALPWHRHPQAYAAVVVEGRFQEAGERGRRDVKPGSVLLHAAWEAHSDTAGKREARVLNLPLPNCLADALPAGQVGDLCRLTQLLHRDRVAAGEWLAEHLEPGERSRDDWPDRLAAALLGDPWLELGSWAETAGLRPESLSRGFRRAYGVTPKKFRAAVRARAAWRRLVSGSESASLIAAELGYSDQAHMSRAVSEMTGRPPGYWRRSSGFKTGSDPGRKIEGN